MGNRWFKLSGKAVGSLSNKFDPLEIERQVSEYWEREQIYRKLKTVSSKRAKRFLFLDGPPYTSSPVPHIGTVWNKVLKDSILRFMRLRGLNVWDRPGYDCHGLPIEVAMERKLGIKTKTEIVEKIGVERFVSACSEFAKENAASLSVAFRDVGVFMDWENPYMTLSDEFISRSWRVIKAAHEKGLLERSLHVVSWCPRCQTTLADYETEYKELKDPSIYVKFKVVGEQDLSLLIWTTTPWTIPANVFVMINGEQEYAEVRVGKDRLIIASARVEPVMKEAGVSNYVVVRRFSGKELVGVKYVHPLGDVVPAQAKAEQFHFVIDAGVSVSMDEGTGLVHSAPGHGAEDYEQGLKIGAPVIMLVNEDGTMTSDAGKYAGIQAREASEIVLSDLRSVGALFHSSHIHHNYPTCWRCHTPVLLRATKQWFIKVTKLKEQLKDETGKVNWIPSWAKVRMSNFLDELRDWVISRQRFWGNPLPIWECNDCGHLIVVGDASELASLSSFHPKELHRPWIDEVRLKCPKCGGEATRVPDVADVWFDSSVAFYAQGEWAESDKADLILEGTDQLRGWFFSLLRSGVILTGTSPYRNVLVHGFMLDEQGREMHKSLGNYVEPSAVTSTFGRDVLRLWLLKNIVWEDVKFSFKSLELAKRQLQVVWNTFVFASVYMSLDSFDPTQVKMDPSELTRKEDRWIVSRYNSMLKEFYSDMEQYKVHEAVNRLFDFLVEDVSRFYLRLARKRAWVEGQDKDKLIMYAVLYKVLRGWLILASVVTPYVTEKIYREFVPDPLPSVSMETSPEVEERYIDRNLEESIALAREIAEAGLNARAKGKLKLRWPLKKALVFLTDRTALDKLREVEDIVKSTLNVREIEIVSDQMDVVKLKAHPNPSTLGRDFRTKAKELVTYIESNPYKVAEDIVKFGSHEVELNGVRYLVTRDHVRIGEELAAGLVYAEFDGGAVALSSQVSQEEEEEGIIRDVVRRVQFMRKKLALNVEDNIKLSITPPHERMEALKRWTEYVKSETRSIEVTLGEAAGELVMEWDIEGETFIIGISRA
ncbi:isoleucine--tRNA ligase [Sulfodiicoccus acidiphilus]|uniref:Isoleucine--tRNA ligase n=1 Tax=Sulfodiicoccus acidiphilus TaxID=1670455 RepID=A0A348B140_9CREN|nr:isoleucine--tRNA ligase [Sulfodiicoccus acidiphilus]BBD71892.1 isoleucine--tRNA ligase [Sulfodiicoccus acidiphilus]GGT91251.1 isoleucine--tRNA ligase [Sulfodiicoccus acidiphilus]